MYLRQGMSVYPFCLVLQKDIAEHPAVGAPKEIILIVFYTSFPAKYR